MLRWRKLLDHVLQYYCRPRLAKLDPPVLIALRLGLYQLRFLDRVPPRAAVHESVALAASARRSAGGLVNAVLRNYLRADHPWPHRRGDERLFLYTGLSHPDWLVDRYTAAFGRDRAIDRLEANNRSPKMFLRVTARRDVAAVRRGLEEVGVLADRFPLAPRCLQVIRGNPVGTPLHREGAFQIQDAGSQLVGWLLPLDGARRALDACAAPGGKAAILAERLDPRRLFAADVRPRRAALLARTVRRLGAPGVLPLAADAARPPFPEGSFDRVLLDVPCSGLGTVARNPDIKWTSSPERLRALARAAESIAAAGLRLLAPGGLALYSVCSLEPEETSEAVAKLLEACPGLKQVSLSGQLPPPLHDLLDEDGAVRIAPESRGTDGYFAALLQRVSDGTTGLPALGAPPAPQRARP